MNIQIVGRASSVDEMLRTWTQERIMKAFRNFAHRITDVIVRLEDTNGPRGGIDKRVAIEVFGDSGRVTGMQEHAQTYEAALVRVSQRVKHFILRSPDYGSRRPIRRRADTVESY